MHARYNGFRSTKLQLVVLAFLVGTLMLVLGKITGDNWTVGVLGLVASYVVGDVGARFASGTAKTVTPTP